MKRDKVEEVGLFIVDNLGPLMKLGSSFAADYGIIATEQAANSLQEPYKTMLNLGRVGLGAFSLYAIGSALSDSKKIKEK